MNNSIAIFGIHTGIGKTIATAIIAEAIGADYWKPVQAGIEETDSSLMKFLLTDGAHRVHDEAVILSQPLSPHAAAAIDGVEVDYTKFTWPTTTKQLLVETAGGILSPISGRSTMADFAVYYKLPAILIAQNYLGSINHTLMSIEVLKSRGIPLLGIVMNGIGNETSESFIEHYAKTKIMLRVPHFETLSHHTISTHAPEAKLSLTGIMR